MGLAPPLVVVTAAGHDWGMGHAVRTGALVAALTHPVDLRIIAIGAEASLRAAFPHARLTVTTEDALAAAVTAESAALVLVDLPPSVARPWAALRRLNAPIAAVEDFGGRVDADIVFNGSVVARHHDFHGPAGLRVCAGGAYALIRPDFAAHPWAPPAAAALTVIAGGGDAARRWVFALAEGGLDPRRHGAVTMVVGAAFPDRDRLAQCCAAAGIALRGGLSAAELAGRMAASSTVLITGGMVAYEAAAVGVPAVVNPLLDDMRDEIAAFATAGAAIDLGQDGMNMDRINRALAGLNASPAEAATMSHRQRALVDGRGMARCAAILDTLLGCP